MVLTEHPTWLLWRMTRKIIGLSPVSSDGLRLELRQEMPNPALRRRGLVDSPHVLDGCQINATYEGQTTRPSTLTSRGILHRLPSVSGCQSKRLSTNAFILSPAIGRVNGKTRPTCNRRPMTSLSANILRNNHSKAFYDLYGESIIARFAAVSNNPNGGENGQTDPERA